MKVILSLLLPILFLLSTITIGQSNEQLFSRLSGIKNNGFEFYNIDGYEISYLKMTGSFSKKNIRKKYKKLNVKEEELIKTDSAIGLPNYYTHKVNTIKEGLSVHSSNYFIKTKENQISAITFNSYNPEDMAFQQKIVSTIVNKQIPKQTYQPPTADSVNFGGRMIYLGGYCRWMGINNLQCSGNGQMNWSICKNQEISEKSIYTQKELSESNNNGKVISEKIIDVVFEGVETKATEVVVDFTGATSVAVGMTGGKTLTIYYVSVPVRGNYISCVLSFWNNDNIRKSGLTPLLEEVMELQ